MTTWSDHNLGAASNIGSPTNTGGTATLGAVLGDVANTSIATRLTTVEAAVTNIVNVGSPSYAAPSSYTLTTGTQSSGTFANVDSDNDVYHVLTDVGGAISLIYDWTLDADQQASSIIWRGRWNGTNDTLLFELYDWVAPGWVTWFTQVGVTGTSASSDFTKETPLVAKYTGTGANAGKVRCRITGSGLTSFVLSTDQLIVGKTTAAGGIANGSTITLAGSNTNKNYVGSNWTLALGGQDISGSYFEGAKQITGTASGTTTVTFKDCVIGSGTAGATLPPGKYLRCVFNTPTGQPFTAASAGQYVFIDCVSGVAGSGTPYFTFSGLGVATTGINFRRWSGGSNVTLDADCTMTMEVVTGGAQSVTTGGANVEIRGICRAVTIATSVGGTTQIACVTGPIAISGDAGTVNIFGVAGIVTDTSTGTTVTNRAVSQNSSVLGGTLVKKTITYNASASYAAFTVTGLVAVRIIGYVTEALTSDAATTSVGTTAGGVAGLIAATAGSAMVTIGQVWVDTAPSTLEPLPTAWTLIGDGNDILVTSAAALADGTVDLYCWYVPISIGASVVAA